ncbi:irregular chiasm C-roughest protein [Teleopsis dalmanni]|uniref:irregular chiasm C-roughest protein n=1 Tax=Teleopsis dalmanni TaxID=139649 RepID=UPI0018CE0925|nr:irregular chiasm C-roughest protein [Teleopsis dalmanni]
MYNMSTIFSILLLIISYNLEATIAKTNLKKSSKIYQSDEKPITDGQRFAMEPQDQTAVVGSRVTLPCRVIDKLGALQWTKDDFGLGTSRNLSGFERYSMIGSDEEGDFSLDIYPVMLDDDAKYQCQVGPGPLGELGIRSRFAKLTVLVPPEAPKILQGDYLVTTEDREIELECISVGGKPAAEITWIDGFGNVLSTGIEYFKESLIDARRFTAKSILKLAPKKQHHNTTFICQAQNTADRTYRSAKLLLEVKYAPKVAVSVVGGALAGGHIPEGAEVILGCKADANPKELSYRWFINDDLVTGDFTTKMIIHNVTRQYHNAVVKCEVTNLVGKSEESETLDISYGPSFRHRPISVEAELDATINLLCDVDGNPSPEIEWISENSDKVVGTTGNISIRVSSDTAGRYFCKAAVSGFPEIGAEATVYIKRAPIITSHKVQFGAVGNRAKIDCLAFCIPKADHILWSYEGKIINMTSADPDVYIFEENHLPEGVRAALIIKESQNNHYGKYNCTVINSYGSDSLLITLIPEPGTFPILLIIMGAMSSVAVVLMIVMLIVVIVKRNRKKTKQSDILPEASVRNDKLSDLKIELRSKSYDSEYSESGTAGRTINVTQIPDVQIKSSTLGVPLAGPVKLDESDRYNSKYHLKSIKNEDFKESHGDYDPYFEYALDYNLPTDGKLTTSLKNSQGAVQSATLPHYSNSEISACNNLSLPRNRCDLPQISNSNSAQMGNGFLGHSLLQNGIDSRFSAIYGNPYLRTNSSILPPLPPPSTANPAATPAPPPYHATRNQGVCIVNNFKHSTTANAVVNSSTNGNCSISGSSSNLTASSNTLAAITPLPQNSINTTLPSTTHTNSGQFILPSNGTKKGALATHV